MEITRNVILDLLPLYVAGEVSADTRALVEAYLANDPELAEAARQMETTDVATEIPVPLTKESKMEAYEEAKHKLLMRTIIVAAVLAFAVLGMMGMALLWLGFRVYAG